MAHRFGAHVQGQRAHTIRWVREEVEMICEMEQREFFKAYKGTICLYAILATTSFNFLVFLMTVRHFFTFISEGMIVLTLFGKMLLFPVHLIYGYWYAVIPILVFLFVRQSRSYLEKLKNALVRKSGRLYQYPYVPILCILLVIQFYMGFIGAMMTCVNEGFNPSAEDADLFVKQFIKDIDVYREPAQQGSWFF